MSHEKQIPAYDIPHAPDSQEIADNLETALDSINELIVSLGKKE